jgi:hypothetical protein
MNSIWLNAVRASQAAAFDPDAVTLFAAMTTQPDTARKTLISDTIVALKAAGVWSLLDAVWFMAAHDEQAGRLNWKDPASFTLSEQGVITFTVDRGWQGNGTTGYLNTGWIPATHGVNYQQNDASAGGFVQLAVLGGLGGALSGGLTGPILQVLRGDGNRINSLFVAGTGLAPAISSEGFYVTRRTASDAQQMLTNGTIDATNTAASSTRPAVALYIGARNNNGTADLFSQNRLAMFFTAAAMSAAQQLSLYNTTQAYMTAVGAAV